MLMQYTLWPCLYAYPSQPPPPQHNHFTNHFTWDNPGEPVPEENFWTLCSTED